MNWKNKIIFTCNLLMLAGALWTLERHLDAQSPFGSIVGTLQGASGGAVPDVALTVKNLDDNSSRIAVSDAAGAFQALNLRPGSYEITASKNGFSDSRTGKLTLDARQQMRVDMKIEVAAVST